MFWSKLKCYVSAPFGLNIDNLTSILKSNKIDYFSQSNFRLTSPVKDELASFIEKSDFVLGVINQSSGSKNVIFELGLAVGKSKPIIIINTTKNVLPSNLADNYVIKATLKNHEAIEFKLSAFVENFKRDSESPVRIKSESSDTLHSIKDDDPIKETSIDEVIKTGYDLENYVYQLFKRSGYIVSRQMPGKDDTKIDLTLWLETFENSLGNPVVIEIKRNLNETGTIRAIKQLRNYIQVTKAGLGLLIYSKAIISNRVQIVSRKLPFVILLKVDRLRKLLERGTLDKELRQARNKIAHGGFYNRG